MNIQKAHKEEESVLRSEIDNLRSSFILQLEQRSRDTQNREEESAKRITEQYNSYIEKYHALYQHMLKELRHSKEFDKIRQFEEKFNMLEKERSRIESDESMNLSTS